LTHLFCIFPSGFTNSVQLHSVTVTFRLKKRMCNETQAACKYHRSSDMSNWSWRIYLDEYIWIKIKSQASRCLGRRFDTLSQVTESMSGIICLEVLYNNIILKSVSFTAPVV
jgi:hypothetical protein